MRACQRALLVGAASALHAGMWVHEPSPVSPVGHTRHTAHPPASSPAAAERAGLVPPALLVAVMTALGVSVERAAFVGANHSTMESAKTAGMLAAAVPPSLAARGGYTAADVSFDGFGPGGGVTWRKLKAMLQAQQARMAEG